MENTSRCHCTNRRCWFVLFKWISGEEQLPWMYRTDTRVNADKWAQIKTYAPFLSLWRCCNSKGETVTKGWSNRAKHHGKWFFAWVPNSSILSLTLKCISFIKAGYISGCTAGPLSWICHAHLGSLSYGLWHVCIFYEAALNHSDKQRYLFNIVPGFHVIIHPSILLPLFFLQLLMQQPELKQSYLCDTPLLLFLVCWCICLFSVSPTPQPQPLFFFQSFTKTSFLPIFFPPYNCTSITCPGESCGLSGRRKEKCMS